MSPLIRIERLTPPVAVRLAPRLVHPEALERRIDEIWAREKARRGDRLFDGAVHALVEATASEIVLRPLRYRDVLARRLDPGLGRLGLDILPAGVTGVLRSPDGVVLGLRAGHVAADAGLWEAAPAGVLSGADPIAQVLEELREELGIEAGDVAPPVLCGVVHSPDVADLVLRLETSLSGDEIRAAWRRLGTDEYDDVAVVPLAGLAPFLAERRDRVLPALRPALVLAGVLEDQGPAGHGDAPC
jgi:hypothetical protein